MCAKIGSLGFESFYNNWMTEIKAEILLAKAMDIKISLASRRLSFVLSLGDNESCLIALKWALNKSIFICGLFVWVLI